MGMGLHLGNESPMAARPPVVSDSLGRWLADRWAEFPNPSTHSGLGVGLVAPALA